MERWQGIAHRPFLPRRGWLTNDFKLRKELKVFLLLFLQKKDSLLFFFEKRPKKLLCPARVLRALAVSASICLQRVLTPLRKKKKRDHS
jgi:hypothetical protein